VLGFFALAVLPATWLCVRRCADLSLVARLALGFSLGLSLFIVGVWYVGVWSLDGVWLFWGVQCAAAAWLSRRRSEPHAAAGSHPDAQPPQDRRWAWLVPLPLVAGAVVHLYAFFFSELPLGVDPAFHCVVAQRVRDVGRAVGELWPLEDLKLNYPIGSHLWLAVAARWTGLEVHQVFRHSFVIALSGMGLVVAACAERLFGSMRHAVAGSFAFVFASYQASLFPYTWGGLPSLLAMWQGLAALYALAGVPGPPGVLAGAILFGGMMLTHHHTLVALPAAAAVAVIFGYWRFPEHRPLCRRVLLGLMGGGVLAAIYLAPLAARIGQVGETGIVQYAEEFNWPWKELWSWGPSLLVAAAVGVGVNHRGKPDGSLQQTGRTPSESRPLRWMLLSLIIICLCAFAALDYGGRLLTTWLRGAASAPFTPSRFLFDAQCVLAIFAGGGMATLLEWLLVAGPVWVSSRLRPLEKPSRIVLTAVGGISSLVALAATTGWAIQQTRPRLGPVPSDVLLPVGRWIDANLPTDAFVLLNGPQDIWTTYACRREAPLMFIPISEPAATQRRRLKQTLLERPGDRTWQEWSTQLGKPVYVIGAASDQPFGRPPVYVSGRLAVFELVDQ
jgi:hypothetical protein